MKTQGIPVQTHMKASMQRQARKVMLLRLWALWKEPLYSLGVWGQWSSSSAGGSCSTLGRGSGGSGFVLLGLDGLLELNEEAI